jgi:peptidyl-tRNA hydrolase, PTH1 family
VTEDDSILTPEQQLIVGLGNPGSTYALTRHNMGFLVVERLVRRWGWTLKPDPRLAGKLVRGLWHGRPVSLLLPTTYMNDYKFSPGQVLVICDDVALDYGKIRLRAQGTPGGHNGLKSVEAHLHTQRYARLKMGVGAAERSPLKDHVLGKFTGEEFGVLDAFLDLGVDTVEAWIEHGVGAAMNRVNGLKAKDGASDKGAPKQQESQEDESSTKG